MTPLNAFQEIADSLGQKPLSFWPEKSRQHFIALATDAVKELKEQLEQDALTDSPAYACLLVLEQSIASGALDEKNFLQNLRNLLNVYSLAAGSDKDRKRVAEVNTSVIAAEQEITEYYMRLDMRRGWSETLSPEAQKKHDLETIQNVGIFYVLEYTLQVLFEFTRLTEKDREELVYRGLRTSAGNLPGLLPLVPSFRKELCLAILDEKIRAELLSVFYDFEEALRTEDMEWIGPALKKFNLSVIQAFSSAGLQTYQSVVYKPFGDTLPMKDLLQTVEKAII